MSSFQCDFIFQHRFGKKWITYSEAEIDALNKAQKRNKKTVTLPSKDPKKQIVVNFESMLQKNNVSNVEQRVRALIYTKNFHAWMWQDEDDEYSSFRPFQIYFLEAAFQQKLNEVKFYNFGDYTVDIKSFRQINEESRESRPVIREKVSLNLTQRISEIAHQNKNLCDEMTSVESLRFICRERRIFDPAISLSGTPMKSSRLSVPNELLDTSNAEDSPEFFNSSVDHECPSSEDYSVYSAGDLYYSATLTLSSLESNMNKYLIMQVLFKDKKYFFWQRWGRIGNKAKTELKKFNSNLSEAKSEFEEKFYEKTKNRWQEVRNFKAIPGKYDLLQMDLSAEVAETNLDVDSNLPSTVKALLLLITSRKMMSQIMEDMAYDLKRAPLGKLTVNQIKDGYLALSKVAGVIAQGGKGKDLINACDEFYTKIPHNFGRKKLQVILTQEDVEEKLRMLEALLNINIAVNVFNEVSGISQHPLDKYYLSLNCDLKPLNEMDIEFETIKNCLLETHGPTHTNYTMSVESIFACNKQVEQDSYSNYENKYLLWHGSRLTNWIGILKEGLRIAPFEAPSTGTMFGKGLYFADCSSKSANYCYPTKKQNTGILLLCEVCLGNSLQLFHSVEGMPYHLPSGYESIIGKGKYVPSSFKMPGFLSRDAKLPKGPLIEDNEVISSLVYNEYVVYSTKQVKMKYLILVNFNFA